MLKLYGKDFARGRSRFQDHAERRFERTAKIYVKMRLNAVSHPVLAQLDTGSAYSILDREVAEAEGALGGGDPAAMHTRYGLIEGHLVRIPVLLLADEGVALNVEGGLFFVSEDWSFGNFLGYTGFLENIRIALDPPSNHFYFGLADQGAIQDELSDEELARLGDEIYDRDIAPHLKEEDKGKYVHIDVVSGDYEIDRSEIAASKRLRSRRPDAQIWFRRVGSRYARRFGFRPRKTARPL